MDQSSPSHGSPVVSLRGVSKSYATGVQALADFDLVIRAVEFVSFLGPAGCGKSTALRIVAGLSAATAGRVEWPNGEAPIGFVFQDPTLMPWATVEKNVALPLTLAGRDDSTAIADVLQHVGLQDFASSYPRERAGGMKMRASIARALVTGPDLLLMDEPFAALDEITRFKLNNELLGLWHESKRTVVFVTHSVFESVFLSQRIVVMAPRPGRVFTEIAIPAAYPRDENFRTTAEYAGFCSQAGNALRTAMGEAG